jgi:hypothetical protein
VKLHKTASTAQFPDDFQSPVLQTNLLSEREGEIDVQWYEIEHNEDVTKWNDFFLVFLLFADVIAKSV